MDGISVYSEDSRTTWVPNEFIDYYMPRANGTFVKVYIYLLRCLTAPGAGFGISAIADALEETEKDILRALRYWEREQVLKLSWKNDTELSGIKLLRLSRPATEQAASFVSAEDSFSVTSATSAAPAAEPVSVPVAEKKLSAAKLPEYSLDQLDAFSEGADTAWLIHAVEQYLERMLKPADVQLILFFHEELHFSNELILHLYEYCVSRGKKASSYIQKVAISWHENGITTVEAAESYSLQFDSNFSAVNRAFALNRAPGVAERRYINRWNTFGFSADIIEEACSRTLLSTSRPDFKYADKILENWHEKGVRSISDIRLLDRDHAARQTAAPSREPSRTVNRFNAFPQRDYSGSDISELEKTLLGGNN